MMKIVSLILITLFFIGCNQEKTKEVSIYMWGGSKEINSFFDNFVIPNVKKELNITLHRVPINSVKMILQKIELEKKAQKEGSVDIIWLNGENFKIAKQKDLLYGPFVDKLENANRYLDKNNISNFLDFGQNTQGYEAPFGRAQFVMVYNSKKVQNPPSTLKQLLSWIKDNPGRFTYPALPDFTGSAFVRELFMLSIGGAKNFDKNSFNDQLIKLFEKLNGIKPYLFEKGEYMPNSSALLDTLYSKGEVDFTMSYNPSHALNKIKAKDFPEETKTFIFDNGTLANTHFLAISSNSQHKKDAIKVINYLLSPIVQLQKAKPEVWGDGTVLDIKKLKGDMKQRFLKLSLDPSLIPSNVLEKSQIPELDAKYVDLIEKLWEENVKKK